MGNCVLTFPARWPQRMLARQSRSSRGHSLSARYRSRPRRIRKPPSIPPEHPFLRWSRRAVFPTPPGFWEKSRGSVPSGIAIPRIAWATRTSPESWGLPSRTDTPRVLCASRLRGKCFEKLPAEKAASGPWTGGKQARRGSSARGRDSSQRSVGQSRSRERPGNGPEAWAKGTGRKATLVRSAKEARQP